MGSDEDHKESLRIQLSDHGTVAISDPMHLRICSVLENGGMRPSDISSTIGVASSSLHFILDKLVDSGVLSRIKPEPGRKTVMYALSSATVMRDGRERRPELLESIASCPKAGLGDLLSGYLGSIGMDASYLEDRYAASLAERMSSRNGGISLGDAVFSAKKTVSAVTGHGVNVFSLNPLTVILDGDERLDGSSGAIGAFFARLVSISTGVRRSLSSVERTGGDGAVRYRLTISASDERPADPEPSRSGEEAMPRFAVIDAGGSLMTITNEIQLEILESVYEAPRSVTEIVSISEAPRSTVTSNILKMIEDGILNAYSGDSDAVCYAPSCRVVLMKRGPPRNGRDPSAILDGVAEGRSSFADGYFGFVMETLGALGFDPEVTSAAVGGSFAVHTGDPMERLSELASANGIGAVVRGESVSLEHGGDRRNQAALLAGIAREALGSGWSNAVSASSEDGLTRIERLSGRVRTGEAVEAEAHENRRRSTSLVSALLKRKEEDDKRISKDKKYISAALILVVMLAVVLALAGQTGSSTHMVYADSSCDGIRFLDDDGNEISFPVEAGPDRPLRFRTPDDRCIGFIRAGVAVPFERSWSGYMLAPDSDVTIVALHEAALPQDSRLSLFLYNFDSRMDDSDLTSFDGYIDSASYSRDAKGFWVGPYAAIDIRCESGFFVDMGDGPSMPKRLVCFGCEPPECCSKPIPEGSPVIGPSDVPPNCRYVIDSEVLSGIRVPIACCAILLPQTPLTRPR